MTNLNVFAAEWDGGSARTRKSRWKSSLAGLLALSLVASGAADWPAQAAAKEAGQAKPAKSAKAKKTVKKIKRRKAPAPAATTPAATTLRDPPETARADEGTRAEPIPTPPVPPRIAQGKDYEACLAMIGTDPAGAQRIADAWMATGGGPGAVHCLALATVTLGNAGQGAELLDQLAGRSKAPAAARASVYGQAGQAWLIAGDPQRALGSTTLALSLTPDDPDLLIDRSIAEGTLGRYQETIEDLDQALKLAPGRADALVFRAAAHRQLQQLDPAQADIAQALAISPDNPDALLERGLLRQAQGNLDGARADWQRAAELAPGTAAAELAQKNLDRLKPTAAPG